MPRTFSTDFLGKILPVVRNNSHRGLLYLAASAIISTATPATAETYLDIGIGIETGPQVYSEPYAYPYYSDPRGYVVPAPGYAVPPSGYYYLPAAPAVPHLPVVTFVPPSAYYFPPPVYYAPDVVEPWPEPW